MCGKGIIRLSRPYHNGYLYKDHRRGGMTRQQFRTTKQFVTASSRPDSPVRYLGEIGGRNSLCVAKVTSAYPAPTIMVNIERLKEEQ